MKTGKLIKAHLLLTQTMETNFEFQFCAWKSKISQNAFSASENSEKSAPMVPDTLSSFAKVKPSISNY